MTIDQRWFLAASVVVAGFVVGAILAATARRVLGASSRRAALQGIATPTGTFLFWLSVVAGVITAIAFTSPDTLRPIPSDILSWLPRVLVAGLILLAGLAGGGALSAAIAAAAQRAIGHRPAGLEHGLRWAITAAAVVLALGNLGVQTTLLQILVAGVVGSVGLALALLAGLGGHTVAASVAAGRTLRPELDVGAHLTVGDVSGEIVAVRPAVVIVADGEDGRFVVPLVRLMEEPFRIDDADRRRDDG